MFQNNSGSGNQSHVYQIDFTAVASGKRIASSKRRVRWRFGFANLDALAAGQTGTDCRGEEHDVTIVWSVTSGKRLVLADGKEVHTSKNRTSVFEYSWTMKGNHVMKVVAHSQPPMSAVPGFRQYDFFVDGQSFFTFPKVFRLGLAPNDPRGGGRRRTNEYSTDRNVHSSSRSAYSSNSGNNAYNSYGGNRDPSLAPYVNDGEVRSMHSTNIASIEAPHNPEEEDAYLRQAIENSLKETPSQSRPPAASAPTGDNLLLDFMTPAATATAAAPALALPPSTSQYSYDMYGAPPNSGQPQPAFAALPPSTTTNTAPSVANVPQQTSQQQQMVATGGASDPWGMATMAAALPPSQPAVAHQPPNPFSVPATAPTQTQMPLGGGGAPALAATQDPFGAGAPSTQTGAASTPYGVAPTPFGSPPPSTINAPAKEEFTPATQASSIGFASPMAQPFPPQDVQETTQPTNEQEQPHVPPAEPVATSPPADPALLSMNVLSGQPQSLVTEDMTNGTKGTAAGSMADQAYAKLVNMDAFDLVQSKDSEARNNPFDAAVSTSTSIGGSVANASLADMRKAKKPSEPKKSIMNSPAPGAMVLSNNQQGNFGGYGGLSGMSPMGSMGQQHPTMGQPPQTMGQPPQIQGYGGMQQQQSFGQPTQQAYQAPMQQQPSYGMQAPDQGQYMQTSSMQQQQQQQAYGQQPPPLQQQPFQF